MLVGGSSLTLSSETKHWCALRPLITFCFVALYSVQPVSPSSKNFVGDYCAYIGRSWFMHRGQLNPFISHLWSQCFVYIFFLQPRVYLWTFLWIIRHPGVLRLRLSIAWCFHTLLFHRELLFPKLHNKISELNLCFRFMRSTRHTCCHQRIH